MTEFNGVSIVKKANVYFDGKVVSRTVKFGDGSSKTLGFMQVGKYTFNTDKKEIMDILAGEVKVKLADGEELYIKGDSSFEVPAKSAFDIEVLTPTDYCCSFID